MATLSVQTVGLTGAVITTATPGGSGDVFQNTLGDVFFKVINGSGGSINVTATAQNTAWNEIKQGPFTLTNNVVAVANGATTYIGPFPPAVYNNSSGQVAILCSATSSVTVAAVKFRPHGL
jgi:hypothetical protein